MTLKGVGGHIPVDVFHVVLPNRFSSLGNSSERHLLALIEDADARLKAEDPSIQCCRNRTPGRVLRRVDSPVSERQSSSCSGGEVEVLEELSQITLLLDCSTDLFDISEAHLRFARMTSQPDLKSHMPTLKRFVRPSDWPVLETGLYQYASAVSERRRPAPQSLSPVMIQLPGEPRKYLCAKGVSVKAVYSGFRPQGQPTYLHLTLNRFQSNLRQMPLRFMGDVQKSPQKTNFQKVSEAATKLLVLLNDPFPA